MCYYILIEVWDSCVMWLIIEKWILNDEVVKLRELCLSKWYLIYIICIFNCLAFFFFAFVPFRSIPPNHGRWSLPIRTNCTFLLLLLYLILRFHSPFLFHSTLLSSLYLYWWFWLLLLQQSKSKTIFIFNSILFNP